MEKLKPSSATPWSPGDFSENWLLPHAVVPVDIQTTGALLREVQRLRALRSESVEQQHYADTEHEHLGCPVAKTGIYATPTRYDVDGAGEGYVTVYAEPDGEWVKWADVKDFFARSAIATKNPPAQDVERAGAQGNQTTATTDRPAGSTPATPAADGLYGDKPREFWFDGKAWVGAEEYNRVVRELAHMKRSNDAMFQRLAPSVEYVEGTPVGYGEDEISRLEARLSSVVANEGETPRTDAEIKRLDTIMHPGDQSDALQDFARQLERELAEVERRANEWQSRAEQCAGKLLSPVSARVENQALKDEIGKLFDRMKKEITASQFLHAERYNQGLWDMAKAAIETVERDGYVPREKIK